MSLEGARESGASGISAPARIWGGLDASLWVKPEVESTRELEKVARPAVVVLSFGLAIAIGWATDLKYGVYSFFPLLLLSYIVAIQLGLAPKERSAL